MKRLWLCVVLGCGSQPAPHASAPAPSAPTATPAPAQSLFQRLGGLPAITAVVDEFVARTTTDKRIAARFFNTDAVHLKAMLVEQVCEASGGPCKYSGRDMQSSHAGMTLVDEEFNALVEDLVGALDKFSVPAREKGELLGALAALKPQIVAPLDQLKPLDPAKLAAAERVAASLGDPAATELLQLAVTAGRRGQVSYAEQLFSRAELLAGARPLAAIAPIFRASAPPRVETPLKSLPMTTAAQPKGALGSSDDDAPRPRRAAAVGSLAGSILLDGEALAGVGVVMLEPAGGKFAPRTAKQRIVEQRGREFAPHLLAVPVGSTVSFPNFDAVYHNVFSLSSPAAFDLGLYRNGETREITFKKEGIIRLGCNLHPSMSAFVIVVSAPHYAVTDPAGRFAFRQLAPGKYKLKAWTDRSAAPTVLEVAVETGDNKISIPLKADGTQRNPDKFGGLR